MTLREIGDELLHLELSAGHTILVRLAQGLYACPSALRDAIARDDYSCPVFACLATFVIIHVSLRRNHARRIGKMTFPRI